jgi:catechol 2,3-dioxygenase-like lactoylglutathione lyase family enzyme
MTRTCVLLLCSVMAPHLSPAAIAQETTQKASVAAHLYQGSMNVFRRFATERAKVIEFYGTVLGLKPLPTLGLGGGGEMNRFLVGTSEIKFTTIVRNRTYGNGPITDLVGLRVFTFFFTDEAALSARFVAHGYPPPAFTSGSDGRRAALVTDPDGQWVELVAAPGAPAQTYDRIEVGITVSSLEQSRAFYRAFVGLEELPPVRDDRIGVTKYPFRHGTTTVNLWSASTAASPAAVNNGSAGIQYVVNNVDAVDVQAKLHGVTIDQPLANTFGGGLRTIWLADPDGVTNYFAETAQSRRGRPATR